MQKHDSCGSAATGFCAMDRSVRKLWRGRCASGAAYALSQLRPPLCMRHVQDGAPAASIQSGVLGLCWGKGGGACLQHRVRTRSAAAAALRARCEGQGAS